MKNRYNNEDLCCGSLGVPLVPIQANDGKNPTTTSFASAATVVTHVHDNAHDVGLTSHDRSHAQYQQQQAINQDPSLEQLQNCYWRGLPVVCMDPCTKCRHGHVPPHRQCVHVVFLVSFVLFLVVGVALTCMGFLDYEAGGASSRAFRILGIVALLLCIGFLIAACVILSDCVTSAIKQPIDDDDYGYHALYPTYSDSFGSFTDRAAVYANCGHPVLIPAQTHANISNQHLALNNFQPVSATLCASCSCQLLAPVVTRHPHMVQSSVSCPHSIVHLTKDGHVNVAAEKISSETNSSYLFDIPSEDEDPMHNATEELRDWV